jgi:hypothetical protein
MVFIGSIRNAGLPVGFRAKRSKFYLSSVKKEEEGLETEECFSGAVSLGVSLLRHSRSMCSILDHDHLPQVDWAINLIVRFIPFRLILRLVSEAGSSGYQRPLSRAHLSSASVATGWI